MSVRTLRKGLFIAAIGIALSSAAGKGQEAQGPPAPLAERSPDGIWRVPAPATGSSVSVAGMVAGQSTTVRLDGRALGELLARTPMEDRAGAGDQTLWLPGPAGYVRVAVEESPMMERALADRFPQIKTYSVRGVDDPTLSGRFDWSSGTFHAFIVGSDATWTIGPASPGERVDYVVTRAAGQSDAVTIQCLVGDLQQRDARFERGALAGALSLDFSNGDTRRTYRAAIAATAEYAAGHGGTQASALAAITTTINGVNALLEKETAIRLVLVANETSIIYTNSATDPYTSGDLAQMAENENQQNLDAVIGSANYDLGHVFDYDPNCCGASGYAYFGVCDSNWKGKAATLDYGLGAGHADVIRTRLHEFGHQFTARHTFNGTTGSCAFGRDALGSYEIGSGSTPMSYTGLCGAENVPRTELYHAATLEQMIGYTTTGWGNTCAATAATGNDPPLVNAGSDYTIPRSTPFVLTASGSDPNGDTVTYSWEEMDLGNPGPPNTDDGTRPIFRVFAPVTDTSRTFPKLSDILSNTSTFGESLPTTSRTMMFRVTARDNRAGGGGVATDTMELTIASGAGPFAITQPNTAVSWPAGSLQTVTWNVASTNIAPVNTGAVNILLSTDGGQTFPTVLAANTANDGTEQVTLPGTTSTTARVKVEAAGNVFFDISNVNFTIAAAGGTPNLNISKLTTVPSSGHAASGGTITIKDTTRNNGTGAAGISVTKFYLSANKTLDGGDTLLPPTGGRPVGALAAGATESGTTVVTIPGGQPAGLRYVLANADADNTNTESNETDNVKSVAILLGPDLTVATIVVSPESGPPGGTRTVTVTIKNVGAAAVPNTVTFKVRLYYSADSKLKTATDPALGDITITATINPGATRSDVISVIIPSGAAPGGRYIFAVVDADNQVPEVDELKNKKSKAITVS